MVRTLGFHPEDPGSIPHAGDFFLNFNSDTYFQSSANSLSDAYYSFQHSVHVLQKEELLTKIYLYKIVWSLV